MSEGRGLPAADLADAFRRQPAPESAESATPPVSRPVRLAPRPVAPPEQTAPSTRSEPVAVPVETAAPAAGRLVLWTPVAIRERMQAVRAADGTLYRDQVLDALETTVDELPELLSETSAGAVPRGRLFERRPAARRPRSGPRVQLTIGGFLTSQLTVIDDLVASTGASSRSALVNAALDAALPRR